MVVLLPDDPPSESALPAAPDAPAAAPPAPLDKRHVTLLVAPIIAMVIAGQISNVAFSWLVDNNPTLLISLSAPNRNLVIAAESASRWLDAGNVVPVVLYAFIGVGRLLLPDPFFYAIGRHYGENAIGWMERRTPTFGDLLRQFEWLFGKAGWLLVLILPNNYVCLLAGAARMRRDLFWALNLIGTIGRVALMYVIGQLIQDWIQAFLRFVADYRIPLLLVSALFMAFTFGREWKSGNSQVQKLIELEHELEDQAPDAAAHSPDTPGTDPPA